jgi:hypothetical protein
MLGETTSMPADIDAIASHQHLVEGDADLDAVTVFDLHNLHDRAKRFVVGVSLEI